MILNPFKCEDCKRELQPENLKIGFDDELANKIVEKILNED